jgi:two-component sensor histidine kinase
VWQSVQNALEEHRAFEVEYRIETASGAEKYVWEQGTGVYAGGSVSLVEGFVTEITGKKRAEQRLQHAMGEKDNLMKELNHRVKNNLKMVSSLVSLKDMALGDGVDLSDIRHQIDAIQIIHQKLHESGRITHIQVRDYIEDLLQTIFSFFATRAVHIDTEIEEIALPTKQAIPLGLIINEMATNAIKHGFTHQGEARFRVSMSTGEHGDQLLIVSNSGGPFPADIDLYNAETLGLQLITGLVEQLAGTIELQRSPEPTYTVRFPAGS